MNEWKKKRRSNTHKTKAMERSYGERTWETGLKGDKDRHKEDRNIVRDTYIEDGYTER